MPFTRVGFIASMIAASRALAQVNAGRRLRKPFPVYQKAAEEFAVIKAIQKYW
jgi:hypothetical protein